MFSIRPIGESGAAAGVEDLRGNSGRKRALEAALGVAGWLALVVFGATPALRGQSAAPAKDPFAGEAVVIGQYDTSYRYNADGTGDKRVSVTMNVQSEAGSRQLSVLSFPFAADEETATIEHLVVHHQDGSSTETPAADAMEMPAPVTREAPLYSDLKMLQIPVRGLRTGDTLAYEVLFHRKNSEAPGQFWGSHSFLKGVVVREETLRLDVPAGIYLQQWSGALNPEVSTAAGRRVYVWHAKQLEPTTAKPKDDDDSTEQAARDSAPDIAWTTFHTWAEVGAWYRALAAPRAVPTAALRAQADEITRTAKTPEEQVEALYTFVSTHIRYVGIDFGIGRYQPHAAAEVLLNQYGDCKDKDTLFEALLRAKGFASAPALVGVRLKLLPEVPSPAFFNHVITTVNLPSGRVWTDTTPGVTPFRFLIAPVRDKSALLISATGEARIEKTPAGTPFAFSDTFEATGTLTKAGELTAKMSITYRSDAEALVRAFAQNIAPAQWDQGTQLLSNAMGFSGSTSNSNFAKAEDMSVPMHVSYDYSRKPFGDWDNFRIVPLFPVVVLPSAPKKQPEDEIDLGAPRTETAISRIHLPEGFGADLPDAVHVKTSFANFDKTYKLESGDLIVERVLIVRQQKLPAASWQEYKKFTEDISLGDESWVQLTSTTTANSGKHPPKPGENNPQAASLVSEANTLETHGDWDGALKKLDEAKKLNPNQPFLWSCYGFAAMRQNRSDEAKRDYERELSLYPDEGYVERLYDGFLYRQGDKDAARAHLATYFEKHAEDANSGLMLASMEGPGDLKTSIAVLQRARSAAPENEMVLNALGEYLIRDHEEAEAAPIATKLLAKAGTDPMKLNNAAYLLAESNGDLALAEQKSRESLASLESQLAESTVSEANQQAFGRTSLAVAGWDTLGYILTREKKFPEAEDYLEAAWRNRNDFTIGQHYGALLEAEGKPTDAVRIYELALPLPQSPLANRPGAQEMNDRVKRLKASGVGSRAGSDPGQGAEPILQKERTFPMRLGSACSSFESATYRLQISSSGISGVLHVSGNEFPPAVEQSIERLKLPHLVPAHSKALILRDAILTCSKGRKESALVLMPLGGIAAEQAGR